MTLQIEDLIKILLAILAGGAIGIEREIRDKAAGFRTLIFICVGAALFTIFSLKLADTSDPTRIASNIVVGVGFLGAGVILREGGKVIGLTTASTIWLVAALGMGIGGSQYVFTLLVVAIMMIVLWLFPKVEHAVENLHEERTYELVFPNRPDEFERILGLFRKCGVKVGSTLHAKEGEWRRATIHTSGRPKNHCQLVDLLIDAKAVREFHY
jgi:putative Mg2+ transporter-C (MgtC) family protein